jgi:hypothetical protein
MGEALRWEMTEKRPGVLQDEIPILPSGYLDLHRQCINKQTMKTMHISASTTKLHIITKKNDNISIDSTLTGSINTQACISNLICRGLFALGELS